MKTTYIAAIVATFLLGQSSAATLKYCKEENLQGECLTESVDNNGACRKKSMHSYTDST
jgi:hypothetical protein